MKQTWGKNPGHQNQGQYTHSNAKKMQLQKMKVDKLRETYWTIGPPRKNADKHTEEDWHPNPLAKINENKAHYTYRSVRPRMTC